MQVNIRIYSCARRWFYAHANTQLRGYVAIAITVVKNIYVLTMIVFNARKFIEMAISYVTVTAYILLSTSLHQKLKA